MRFQSIGRTAVPGVLSLLFIFPAPAWAGGVSGDCSWNGIPLYGNVKVVDSFPDIKVKIVSSFPDLKVKEVNSFPDSCGKWRFVDSFPDFKVKFVNSFPDIKIKYVESFPGLP
ncbi:MAG: hypothetical protein MR428_07450 [Mesosutterella sp.]|nr:hypothetical protein [Mesosutterella sp.]